MSSTYTTADLRNCAVVGHAGCGKTTLVERILEQTKVIGRMGSIEEGNTVCDFETEEHNHQHSLTSAIVHADVDGKRINLIDTPGYPDFIGQAFGIVPAVETVLVVVDAQKGIENVTRRMMKLITEERQPSAIVINKIDGCAGAGEKVEELISAIRETFGNQCLPINVPSSDCTSVIDCFTSADGDSLFSSPADVHSALVDQIVEVDDALMEQYLETGEVSSEQLTKTFTRALTEGHLIPILFTSGRENVGIAALLSAITEHFPSPTDFAAERFLVTTKETEDGEATPWTPDPSDESALVAHVFRVAADPFVGKLSAFRIHQGTLETGTSVHIDDERKPVRLAHIFQLQGKEHVEIHKAVAGDIVAVAKIDELHYNGVIHGDTPFESITVRPVPQPKPMYGLAVSPAKRGEEGKIGQAMTRICEQDPTFVVERDQTTNEMVMRGIGELHLRIVIERLRNQFNLEVETAQPTIAYRETITTKAEGHHRHKKQTGGAGQFGEVYLRVEPLPVEHETGFEFVDDTFGGSVPKQYMPAIEKGVRMVLSDGCVAGYPLQGVRVSVYDGKHHPVDSKEVAFVAAGKKAFIDAVAKAKPILLEPFVSLEISVPQDYMGDVTGDLSGRRGRVQGSDMLPGGQAVITAVAPLGEVMSYASALKAMTQGSGSYTMEFSHHEQTPANVMAEIVAKYKPKDDE
ncbi:MAG: elongation factor G [Planctomycetes bacterium]|nr:elongation factor G [Planctomycetota bacterium]NOG55137.1 elongation factor G [Planctomycetota bacterium]